MKLNRKMAVFVHHTSSVHIKHVENFFPTTVLCQLAKNTGPCKNYTVMWYYNTRENQCERFWYGGCDGNTNRFKSEKECVTTCQNMIFRGTGFLLE